ncbi:MAG TPA: M23 family metallopeptidase [Anaerolineales bacterium]|nr:M23 family metallopeptidase [Anaerolineales bacterium]
MFAFLLIVFISGSASRFSNSKNLLIFRPAFLLAAQEETDELNSIGPVVHPTAPQTCDIHSADYCIVDGNFILKQPVEPELTEPLAPNYTYGLTDKGTRLPHRGVDFSADIGTPVLAAADGEVVFAGPEKGQGYSPWGKFYGNLIVIRHANDLYTLYGHLSKTNVEAGQKVRVGELIGEVGRSGIAIGPHVHFEVRRGGGGKDYFSTENPELWLAMSGDEKGNLYGVLSIIFDSGSIYKSERNIVIEYYPDDAATPERSIYTSTYPIGFENNLEDAVVGNLAPGRYRVVISDSRGVRDRWVIIESGKLTQVYVIHK